MSSERRIHASQANAAKSTGPKTPTGKQRSSQNALRHGLLSANTVLALEDPNSFEDLLASFESAFQPADPFAQSLVENMATAHWRGLRACAMEKATHDDSTFKIDNSGPNPAIQNHPPTKTAIGFQNLCGGSAPAANLLHRYEIRYSRQFTQNFHMLMKWRQELRLPSLNPPPTNLPNEPNPTIEHTPDSAPQNPSDILKAAEPMSFTLAVSATFTAEPIEPVLTFWGDKLQSPFQIRFAPYNQVLQTLLSPQSEFAANTQGANILLLRLQDLGQFDTFDPARIETNLHHLIGLIRESPRRLTVPLIVALCPNSPALAPHAQFLHDLCLRAQAMLEGTPGVIGLSHEAIERLYPVPNPHNPEGERLGQIPFNDLYFAALGTAVIRIAHGLLSPPSKVIALDCDNTLWRGICGEDGPGGIVVDPARRQLQEFMVDQRDQGMLLVLASKNNERDVFDTFEQNPDMPLQLRHLAGWRLNWDPKGGNLADLARELSLGLDSFVFIDDNPKETAEAAESAPEVLSLTLPVADTAIPQFLHHVWAFDHVVVTEEDRQRNVYYSQARDFGRELKQAASLEHFIETLDLHVAFEPLTPQQLPRAAQLTQRTNQFNFTTIRRTEPELQSLDAEILTLQVSDRFGDYGITGVLIFRQKAEALEVDTFLLSCRVLGRGVEHRLMNHLGQLALDRGLETIHLRLIPTKKNEPARQFLEEIGGSTLSAAAMRDLRPRAAAMPPESAKPAKSGPPRKRPDYQDIAAHFNTAGQILAAIRKPAHQDPLTAIWSELLHRTDIGPNDNFFDIGGHSLLVVLLIVRVRETFGVDLAIDDVYSANLTLSGLAARIEAYQLGYDAILKELESLPDEEIDRMLAQQS